MIKSIKVTSWDEHRSLHIAGKFQLRNARCALEQALVAYCEAYERGEIRVLSKRPTMEEMLAEVRILRESKQKGGADGNL